MVNGKSKIHDERENPSGTKNYTEWGQIQTGGKEGKEKEKINRKINKHKILIHTLYILIIQ